MDLQSIAQSLTAFASSGTTFVFVFAVAVGVVLILLAVVDIVRMGMDRRAEQKTWGSVVFRLLIGALVVSLGWTMRMFMDTTGDPQELQTALAYVRDSQGGRNEVSQAVWAAIKAWCIFLGTIAFLRGFLLLDRATQGGRDSGDDVWRSFWHILGGAVTVQLFSSI